MNEAYEKGQRLRLKRPFWGHQAGKVGRVTATHPASPVNAYTAKLKLRGSPLASISDKDAEELLEPVHESSDLVTVTSRHNGRQYAAKVSNWPEHHWYAQILDLEPEAWGRSTSGVGPGPVIDQGWVPDLEKRGWQFPELKPPVDIRDQEINRLTPRRSLRDQMFHFRQKMKNVLVITL